MEKVREELPEGAHKLLLHSPLSPEEADNCFFAHGRGANIERSTGDLVLLAEYEKCGATSQKRHRVAALPQSFHERNCLCLSTAVGTFEGEAGEQYLHRR